MKTVCILLYADDAVISANNEIELQTMLNALATWCNDSCMTINLTKSNNVKFRTPSVFRSCTEFKLGDTIIHYADCCTY